MATLAMPRKTHVDGSSTLYYRGCPISFEIVRVTPALAAEWLAFNRRNRPLTPRTVAHYARLMGQGRWVFNGEPVIFGESGDLLNGQHRLTGCVTSGGSFDVLVVRGVPDDAFASMDTGRKRQPGDVLAIEGATNGRTLAAAALWVARFDAGEVESRTFRLSNSEILDVVHRQPGLDEWAARCHGKSVRACSASSLAFCCHIFSRIDRAAAERFYEDFCSGANLKPDDAVHMLRERLIANRVSKAKLPSLEVVALIFKAWNYRRRGHSPSRFLRWRATGPAPEPFPVPV